MKTGNKVITIASLVLILRNVFRPAQKRGISLLTVVCALTYAIGAGAAQLVFFDEVAVGQSPRGLYNFDTVTGISTLRTTVPGTERFFSMDVRPSDGTVFAVSLEPTPGIFTIDINAGAASLVGLTGIHDLAGVAFHPTSGQLFGLKNQGGLYSINQLTGAATFIGNTTFEGGYVDRGLVFSPSGRLFGFTHSGALYQIDTATGSVAPVGGSGNPVNLLSEDAAFTSAGELFATDFAGTIFRTDPLTGNGTVVGSTGLGSGLLGIIAVPEPSTLALVICGASIVAVLCGTKRGIR
jgi:hypothetical protein